MRRVVLALVTVLLAVAMAACERGQPTPASPKAASPPAATTTAKAAAQATQPAATPAPGSGATVDPARFVRRISNPWWPMPPGSRWTYRQTDADGTQARIEVTVTHQTRQILGITATVVHDRLTQDGQVQEDTDDWYAQDRQGTVWYLGEATKAFDHGRVTSTAGSWQAGVDGAQAGIIMPARPRPGMAYRQEYLRGEAEDAARVLSVGQTVKVPAGV